MVDKLFSFGGTRSDSEESPIGLARRFRELAGFTDDEIESIAEVSLQALNERKGRGPPRSSATAAARFAESRGLGRDRHRHARRVPVRLLRRGRIAERRRARCWRCSASPTTCSSRSTSARPWPASPSPTGPPVVVHAESGAFEDTRKPRAMSDAAATLALARVLLRLRDRRDGGFAEAPPDDQLSLAQVAAWDSYVLGRLAASACPCTSQRWRYNFRNRHGFTDAADAAFDQLFGSRRPVVGCRATPSPSRRAQSPRRPDAVSGVPLPAGVRQSPHRRRLRRARGAGGRRPRRARGRAGARVPRERVELAAPARAARRRRLPRAGARPARLRPVHRTSTGSRTTASSAHR